MTPLEASLFKPLSDDVQQLLIRSGVIPVNDSLLPLWGNRMKIVLLYGSYGSGKSVFLIDDLINKCIEDPYFRCFFGRKILDTVRGSLFKTITDRIKELHQAHLFSFSDAPNGSLVVQCRANGNAFYPFGANNPASLKSIKDPTHMICDEFDQFTFEDFGLIYSRLRTEKAQTQFYGAFNTDRIYQSHWLRKVFFDGEFSHQAYKQKVNYTENFFIDQDEYYERLKLIANGNIAILNAIANGEWGVVRTGSEFWKNFDESRDVVPRAYEPGAIWLSLDENVNPYVTITIWQVRAKSINQIGEMLCESPNNNAPKAANKMIAWLRNIGHKDVVFVCGDPSASKRSTVDANSASFYDKFIENLRLGNFNVTNKVRKSAPEVALSAAFINAIYETGLYGWHIFIGDLCFRSIEDYMLVKEDAEGRMFKPEEKDKETKIKFQPVGHISDTKRYLIITILEKEWQDYRSGTKNRNLVNKLGYFR